MATLGKNEKFLDIYKKSIANLGKLGKIHNRQESRGNLWSMLIAS
jgi:hypothetical protein